jgi:hypothetical protein
MMLAAVPVVSGYPWKLIPVPVAFAVTLVGNAPDTLDQVTGKPYAAPAALALKVGWLVN